MRHHGWGFCGSSTSSLSWYRFTDFRTEHVNDHTRQCRSDQSPVSCLRPWAKRPIVILDICAQFSAIAEPDARRPCTRPISRDGRFAAQIRSAHFFGFIVVELGKNESQPMRPLVAVFLDQQRIRPACGVAVRNLQFESVEQDHCFPSFRRADSPRRWMSRNRRARK